MSFLELGDFPDRLCAAPKGSILEAFPPTPLTGHFANGYRFLAEPCYTTEELQTGYCVTGQEKMDPSNFGPDVPVPVYGVQAALTCSMGVSDEELISLAEDPIRYTLWKSVDDRLLELLIPLAIDQTPFPVSPLVALAEAAQFLAVNSSCGTGVIYGPLSWFSQLGNTHLIYNEQTNTYYDLAGNIVIPSSHTTDIVYAFDSTVDVMTSTIELLDEFFPDRRQTNTRTARAEQLYTVAINPCVVGSFDISTGGGSGTLDCETDSVTICPGDDPIIVDFSGASAVVSSVTSSISTVTLLPPSPTRKGAILWNDSTATAFVKLGPGASSSDFSWKISTQSGYELPTPTYIGEITAVWDSANGAMQITELL